MDTLLSPAPSGSANSEDSLKNAGSRACATRKRDKYVATWTSDRVKLPAMKRCSLCKKMKSTSCFVIEKRNKSGLSSACKECNKLHYGHARAERRRAKNLLDNYGLLASEYDAMYDKCGRLCEICGREDNDRRLAVDHCHSTGKVRGLLCGHCNRAIGVFHDDPIVMARAAAYLSRG